MGRRAIFLGIAKQLGSDHIVYCQPKRDGKYVQLSTDWPEICPSFVTIKAGKWGEYTVGAKSFAYPLERTRDSFAVYVFDPDTVAKYTLEELKRDSNYLKRYLFGYGDYAGSRDNPIVYP